MKIENFEGKIEIPEGVDVKIEHGTVEISKGDAKLSRALKHRKINLSVADKNIVIAFKNGTKREKTMVGTFKAHIRNMLKGITEGHLYKLKVCSGHFPMNVAVKDKSVVVNNFLGEKTPRELELKGDVVAKLEGDIITVEGIEKEMVAQAAADIERLTKLKGKDLRIFQDGIYIIEKDGKAI